MQYISIDEFRLTNNDGDGDITHHRLCNCDVNSHLVPIYGGSALAQIVDGIWIISDWVKENASQDMDKLLVGRMCVAQVLYHLKCRADRAWQTLILA